MSCLAPPSPANAGSFRRFASAPIQAAPAAWGREILVGCPDNVCYPDAEIARMGRWMASMPLSGAVESSCAAAECAVAGGLSRSRCRRAPPGLIQRYVLPAESSGHRQWIYCPLARAVARGAVVGVGWLVRAQRPVVEAWWGGAGRGATGWHGGRTAAVGKRGRGRPERGAAAERGSRRTMMSVIEKSTYEPAEGWVGLHAYPHTPAPIT